MGDGNKEICRFCLNLDDKNFSSIEASDIGKLRAIFPEMVLGFPNKFMVCSKCRNILEKSFELHRTLSINNDKIQTEKEKTKAKKIDLHAIVDPENPKSNKEICRICFKMGQEPYNQINEENSELKTILKHCIPDLDISVAPKPAICCKCHVTLSEMYSFKKNCLSVEEKIQSCYDSDSPDDIDLNKVLMTKADDENDFLSAFEVKDEEDADIFDNIPNSNSKEENRKRSVSQSFAEETQKKKQKLLTGEIVSEQLPPFEFSLDLLQNPFKVDMWVEDWVARVEQYKQKFGWSDYTTIHKVLVQLKGMKELYVWFSNIADIMNWDQWKMKLLRAFPPKNDYFLIMKKMMVRKKRKEETYVSYYNDKVKLLEDLALTGEQKVSCIFGGIPDVLVSCVGRIGDFKNPEDLIDYFKSCDDKQSVEAAAAANDFKEYKKPFLQKSMVDKKNLKKKCFECGRVGHMAIDCYYRTKKVKLCLICKQPGHLKFQCPMRSVDQDSRQNIDVHQKQLPKHPKAGFEERCTGCHKKGHSISNCFHEWSKKLDTPKGSKQGTSGWSRCRSCGQYGNKENPCCSARMSQNGSYVGSYQAQNDYNNEICLNCYKMGHATHQCHL